MGNNVQDISKTSNLQNKVYIVCVKDIYVFIYLCVCIYAYRERGVEKKERKKE